MILRTLPLAVLFLAGCTAAPALSPTTGRPALTAPVTVTSPSTSISPTGTPDARVIDIVLKAGRATPNGARVDLRKGENFVLSITSDHDDEVHVHGFDTTIPVKAGKAVTRVLLADRTGRFEVESHSPALVLVILQIR